MLNTEERLERLDKATTDLLEQVYKSNSAGNKLYSWVVRLFSLVVLGASVYTAVVGMAGSAAVLAMLFLITWFMYAVTLGVSKAIEEKAKTYRHEYTKLQYGPLR